MKIPHALTATTRALALALATAGLALPRYAPAQAAGGMNAYPNAGQSQEQQSRDRFECHQWAVQQSGFDPTMAAPLPPPQQYAAPPPPPPPPPRQQQSSGGLLGFGNGGLFQGGGMLGDAASGAALGAAGGAIAGDAGEGAAIGAIAGTLFGALNRGTQQPQQSQAEQDYYYQQQQQQYYQQQQQAQQSQAYMQRQEQTESYRRAFGACMTSRNYYVQ